MRRRVLAVLDVLWRAARYEHLSRPHPAGDVGVDILRERRSQDCDPYPGGPS